MAGTQDKGETSAINSIKPIVDTSDNVTSAMTSTPNAGPGNTSIRRPWQGSPTGVSPPPKISNVISDQASELSDDKVDEFFLVISHPKIEFWLRKIMEESVEKQMGVHEKRIAELESKVTDLEGKLRDANTQLKKQRDEQEQRFKVIESDLDELQQYGRRNALRIVLSFCYFICLHVCFMF